MYLHMTLHSCVFFLILFHRVIGCEIRQLTRKRSEYYIFNELCEDIYYISVAWPSEEKGTQTKAPQLHVSSMTLLNSFHAWSLLQNCWGLLVCSISPCVGPWV